MTLPAAPRRPSPAAKDRLPRPSEAVLAARPGQGASRGDISGFRHQPCSRDSGGAGDPAWAPLALSEAQKRILRSHVHEALRLAIIVGRYAENERLNERALALEFGVSTTPLKEAFRQLEAEGLIETLPRRGVRVRFGLAWAEEMILARAALESTIATVATERITAAQKQALRDVLSRMKAATGGTDVAHLVELNSEYHDIIHLASRCAHLTRLIERQRFYDVSARRVIHLDPAERRTAYREHGAVARAIIAGRAEEAGQLMTRHVRRSGSRYLAHAFPDAGPRRRPNP
jgi:DNA-binding GntR family transcriptional regulator